ncbi:MAG: AAA family ATPase [Methanomassiliicoccales archaeon]|jgi:CO dehydrogenase maturation factor|nr:AAA family ATPase [Methanomassiliicoccales archaeon]MDD1756454.1 AAA family ATPase [Methanomassiliicoccales archaeon]
MSYRIAVVGKGGVGKSTISAMLVRALHQSSDKLIMAVDADPNANLGEKLGARPEHTIGELREQLLKKADEIPPGQSKQEYVEYQMRLATVEGPGFDLLTMGRPEGPGCYCYINNILRTFLDLAMEKYDFVVIDNEAGMEHLSRRTTMSMDVLLLVTDPTKVGVETASRLLALAKEMGLEAKKKVLIINGMREALHDVVQQEVERIDVDEVVRIPFSDDLLNFSTEGLSIWELSEADHAYKALATAAARII